MGPANIPEALRDLLHGQILAVLSTHEGGQPYASLVGFAAAEDLKRLWFVTPRATRKYANLVADGRAALLIDNRAHCPEDFHAAMACTAVGAIVEPAGAAREQALAAYCRRLPHLAEFARAPSCALVELAVSRYVTVTRFQQVTEYVP
jgi:hypothetical protein